MKCKHLLPIAIAAMWFSMGVDSPAQIIINYDFATGSIVPDNGQVSVVKTLGELSGLSSITNVVTRLNLTSTTAGDPMYLGDLYASLTFGTSSETQRIAVLLNRPGRNLADAFGSSLSSLNVTLDDSVSHTNIWGVTSPGTGTYNADGRLEVNPGTAGVAFAAGSNGLAALNGTPPASDRVSLLIADYSQGGTATLASWGLSITGVSASSGTLTPGANASISDAGAGSTNTVVAKLDTTGADADALVLNVAGTMTFSDSVIGSAGLTKNNSGMVKLNGANTYAGATLVNAGALSINGSTSPSSAVTVSGAGTKLMGNGTVGGATTIHSGAILAPGNSVGLETFTNTLTLESGSIFEWEMASTPKDTVGGGIRGTDYDAVNVGAAIPLAGSGAIFRVVLDGTQTFGEAFWNANHTWTDIFKTADSGTNVSFASIFSSVEYYNATSGALTGIPATQGSFTYSGNTLTWNYTAVPEPTSALAGLLLGAGLLRRRRK